ncbi:MAG TPA: YgiQ family radical SAM protein, partial [Armatimonadota bacterium]|nr:YgiQ family radical SAM protein [Armatimonadota bacterium]
MKTISASTESLFDPRWRVPGTHPPKTHSSHPLPMSWQEMEERGWDACDIILVTGDAYVDHPSFGVPLIGRWLAWLGYRVGIIAQPDVSNVEAFRVLGRPRLFWGISAGNIDSQLMRQTIMRKPRHDDAYAPDGKAGARPANASIVYTSLARQAYKGVPVILGGVEASLRRFAYYDYWTEKVKRSIIFDAKADLVSFGMGERSMAEIAYRLRERLDLKEIPGTAEIRHDLDDMQHVVVLPSFEDVSAATRDGKFAFAAMAKDINLHTDPHDQHVLAQRHGDRWLVVHRPSTPLTTDEIDLIYALPFTRHPHPAYGDARIPAYEMIKDSITTHR